MKHFLLPLALALTTLSALGESLHFSGYEWTVRSGRGGPGPNFWEGRNVWLDESGALHLKIAQHDGNWTCAEVTMLKRLGFGRYEFQVRGALDRLDDNVVLGLFNYPTKEVGSDGTHEIDIEFSRWGSASNPMGNYTVWPVERSLRQETKSFPFTLEDDQSMHRFTWSKMQISFQSFQGLTNDRGKEIGRWTFQPEDLAKRISAQPMPIHINLWLFKGLPPKNKHEVEVVVQRFTFTNSDRW